MPIKYFTPPTNPNVQLLLHLLEMSAPQWGQCFSGFRLHEGSGPFSDPSKPFCSFQVDLSSGCSTKPPSDVALRLSPRLQGSPCVVCSSLLQGSWTQEETLQQLPYKHGAPFETIILAQNDAFKVSRTLKKGVQSDFIPDTNILVLAARWQ